MKPKNYSARKKLGIGQEAFALILKVKKSMVCMVESGARLKFKGKAGLMESAVTMAYYTAKNTIEESNAATEPDYEQLNDTCLQQLQKAAEELEMANTNLLTMQEEHTNLIISKLALEDLLLQEGWSAFARNVFEYALHKACTRLTACNGTAQALMQHKIQVLQFNITGLQKLAVGQ